MWKVKCLTRSIDNTSSSIPAVQEVATKTREFLNTVRILDFLNKRDRAKLGDISEYAGMSKSGTWFRLNKLYRLGLVEKHYAPVPRITYASYSITDVGREILPVLKNEFAKKIIMKVLKKDYVVDVEPAYKFYKMTFNSGMIVLMPRTQLNALPESIV